MRRFYSILVAITVAATVCSVSPAQAAEVTLRPPTDAEIVDHFRPPSTQFGPGNRGLDYNTHTGDEIVAAGGGVVIFAGLVAGTLHVTIEHDAELLSSYSFVDRVLVRTGDEVEAGELIAIAGEGFHFGTRINQRYVDPEELFGVRSVSVRLVPHDDQRATAAYMDLKERSEAIRIHAWVGSGGGGSFMGFIRGVGSVGGTVLKISGQAVMYLDPRDELSSLFHTIDVVLTLAAEFDPRRNLATILEVVWTAIVPQPCTEGSVVVSAPTERRIAVVIDGLDSNSSEPGAMGGLDLSRHGYEADDIVRFSYNGGAVPTDTDPDSWLAALPTSEYSASDTRGAIEASVDKVAQLLEDVAAANPGVVIDVYGHSLGGLITRVAVNRVGGEGGTVPVDVSVVFGAPNEGAPLAEVGQIIAMTTPGTVITKLTEPFWPDMILNSEIMDDLSPSGYAGDTSDVPFPPGVTAVSVGARYDFVVPASMTQAPGAANVTVVGEFNWSAHGDLPGYEESDREVALALAGMDPACQSVQTRLANGFVSNGIEQFEHLVAASILSADVAFTPGWATAISSVAG